MTGSNKRRGVKDQRFAPIRSARPLRIFTYFDGSKVDSRKRMRRARTHYTRVVWDQQRIKRGGGDSRRRSAALGMPRLINDNGHRYKNISRRV